MDAFFQTFNNNFIMRIDIHLIDYIYFSWARFLRKIYEIKISKLSQWVAYTSTSRDATVMNSSKRTI